MVEARAQPPLSLLCQSDLQTLELPPRGRLLGDWLTERHPCMVYAQTGRGKSLFAMSLALAVAGGGEVFGWKAPSPSTVLYVDAEMDLADIRERDALLLPSISSADKEALGGNLHILARHGQPEGAPFPDLVEEAGRRALMEIVRKLNPAMVILDNLSTLAEIRDENDAAAFAPVLRTLWELRQLGCAVILVHHTGKQEGKFRGSSKLAATFESVFQLAPNDDLLPGDTGFAFRVDKFRGAAAPAPFKAQLTVDNAGKGRWEISSGEDRHLQNLLRKVRSRDYATQNALATVMGVEKGTLSKWKKRALGLDLITHEEWERCLSEARQLEGEEIAPDWDSVEEAIHA
ncbi:MAG: AAA family ATPase [Hyphomonas sp.]